MVGGIFLFVVGDIEMFAEMELNAFCYIVILYYLNLYTTYRFIELDIAFC